MKRKIIFTSAILGSVFSLFVSCASYNIVVGISPIIKERYGEYISVEVDVVMASADVTASIKKAGLDGYFNPQNPIRDRLNPVYNANTKDAKRKQTAYFSETNTLPQSFTVQKPKDEGKPQYVIIMADLPPVRGVNASDPDTDGRLLFLAAQKSLIGDTVYVQVDDVKIEHIKQKPKDPRAAKK